MSENIAARVGTDIARSIRYLVKEEKTDKSKLIRELLADAVNSRMLDLALEKYSKKSISLGKAAELAGVSIAEFMKVAAERKIPLHYSVSSLENDFRAVA